MSDEVKAGTEPAWKTDPLLAHIPLTEEGVARWRARWQELEKMDKKQAWDDVWRKMGLDPECR